MRVPSWAPDWERAMGYRKFLKDYEIRREPQADGKVKKVRVYVGLYYRFTAAPEEVAQVRRRLPWLLEPIFACRKQLKMEPIPRESQEP